MQTTKESDLAKRARYYQALMDIECLDKGRPYSELPESYIVFICLDDPFGGGLARYTVLPHCKENADFDGKINDKTLKVYYNASRWQELAQLAERDSRIAELEARLAKYEGVSREQRQGTVSRGSKQ